MPGANRQIAVARHFAYNCKEGRIADNLDGREAAPLAKNLGARIVIPCHFDMFEFNTAVNAARKVRRGGAPNRALEKCGMAPLREEHVCRHGRVD